MAIIQGPFQNIISINTASRKYFVAQITGKVYIVSDRSILKERQTDYEFLEDENATNLKASFSNINGTRFATSVKFTNGSFGIVVFDELLEIIQVVNTGQNKFYMIGPCSSNNDFICMIGSSVSRMTLNGSLSIVGLASNVLIEIPEEKFSSFVGADYSSTEVFISKHIAPMPDGGFCYIKPVRIRGEDGSFGDGPYIYRGLVAIYFSSLGTQSEPIYIRTSIFNRDTGDFTTIDGRGNVRVQMTRDNDVFITASRSYFETLSINYIINQYGDSLGRYGGRVSETISAGNGKYLGYVSRSSFYRPTSQNRFLIGSFRTGLVEVASSEDIPSTTPRESSFKQFQNPSKSNLIELYNATESIGRTRLYISSIARDNLMDYEKIVYSLNGARFPEERVSTVSPGPVI